VLGVQEKDFPVLEKFLPTTKDTNSLRQWPVDTCINGLLGAI